MPGHQTAPERPQRLCKNPSNAALTFVGRFLFQPVAGPGMRMLCCKRGTSLGMSSMICCIPGMQNPVETRIYSRGHANRLPSVPNETGQQKDPEVLQSSSYLIANATQKGRSDRRKKRTRSSQVQHSCTIDWGAELLQGSVNGGPGSPRNSVACRFGRTPLG
jgi:hypothetical protein